MKKIYYYQCDINSRVGKKLRSFHHRAVRAAERADEYARKYGAASYIQPVQFFEGGVDYLEFDHEPDTRVWRKRFEADGKAQYEPNCMYRAEMLVIPDDRFQPSDTWNRIYSHDHLTWEQACDRHSLTYWAAVTHYTLTDDKEADLAVISEKLKSCFFVPFIEFYGDVECPAVSPQGKNSCRSFSTVSPSRKKPSIPNHLRRAIQAERDRQALPVVETEWFFALLDMEDLPTDPDERKAFLTNVETPIFFLYADERYYVRCQCPCRAEDLHPVTLQEFNEYKRYAMKGEA